MAFVHPAIGTVVVLYSLWIMSRGLAARRGGPRAHRARRTHKAWAIYALVGMFVALGSGFASTVWLRPDLQLGETWHLALGIAVVTSMTLAAVLTRYFTRSAALRQVHPWIGIAAVVGGIAQAIVGIELLP